MQMKVQEECKKETQKTCKCIKVHKNVFKKNLLSIKTKENVGVGGLGIGQWMGPAELLPTTCKIQNQPIISLSTLHFNLQPFAINSLHIPLFPQFYPIILRRL